MKQHIAFLRGINVGGNNKISMDELKSQMEKAGFSNVTTYINSGNVIFETDIPNREEIKTQCEAIIKKEFQLEIPVTIVSAEELGNAFKNAPDWWNTDKDSRHNAIFVIPPATSQGIIQQVGEIKPEYESIDFFENMIFWSAPIETFSKTKWIKIMGSPVYKNITIRNANTFTKLYQLTQKLD